jgi:acetolactate synthase-1/2/3 large subunit
MRVVDAIAQWFKAAGFEYYFGYAGGAIWPFMDALIDVPEVKGIQGKHESQAVHQADIYYRLTGKLAPVVVTKGPGLMNAVGAMANAMHDSIPVLLIAGGTPTHFLGKAGMQEMWYHAHEDAVSVFRPITKGSWMISRPDTAIDVLNHAVRLATSGRPGPVFVQLPSDIQTTQVVGEIEPPSSRSVRQAVRADHEGVARAAEMLRSAERPVILAGGGLNLSPGSMEALKDLAEAENVPVTTTLTAKGALSEDHPLSLGPVGRSGTDSAAMATREADLIVAVGARFSDNHSSNWRKGMIYNFPDTKLIQVDLDPVEVGRNYPVTLGLISDANAFLRDLAVALGPDAPDRSGWVSKVQSQHAAWHEEIKEVTESTASPIHPGKLAYEVGEALPPGGHVFIDVGDIIQYAEPYMRVHTPGSWHLNPGMAEMGWASQGAPGAALANPSGATVVLTGDGAFLMGPQVLATAMEYGLAVVWVILNNRELSIERKGALAALGRLHPWIHFTDPEGNPYNPDFVKLAESFGAGGTKVEKTEEFRPALDAALASGRPWVIDVELEPDVPTYFTKGLDRAYPANWRASYPAYNLLSLPE